MNMIESVCHFSVKEDNLQWLSTLVLNHCCSGDLPVLLVHHLKFFGSFDKLEVLLNLYWKDSGYNEKSIKSKVRQYYFSDVKRLKLKKLRNTCLLEPSHFLEDCKKYYNYDVKFFLDDIEFLYEEKPDHLLSYKESLSNILPSVQHYRKFKKDLDEISEVDTEGSGFDLGSPPDYTIKDITPEEKEILIENEKWILENKLRVTKEYKLMIIKQFELSDINYFNIPRVYSDDILEIMNDGEELQKVSSRYFQFIHGVRIFERLGGKEINESFGQCMRYLNRRIGEISGLKMELIPEEIWVIHSKKLESINEVNEEYKEHVLDYLNNKISKKEYKDKEIDLDYRKCLLMSDIRSLYTKYVYIQDCYLGRNTKYMENFDLCRFMKTLKYYKSHKLKHSRLAEGRQITEYEASFSPSINEERKLKRDYYTDEEARAVTKTFIEAEEKKYEAAIKRASNEIGLEWTKEFAENFSISEVKDLDEEFVKLKAEYNCHIKSKSKWDDTDREYYYKLLEQIFIYDSDFLKYLPKDIKEGFKENMDRLSRNISFINAMCSNKPKNILGGSTKKKRIKNIEDRTVLDDTMEILKRIYKSDKEKEEEKNKGKTVDLKKIEMVWENSKNNAIDKVNLSVEDFAPVFTKLGDAIELTPAQLGFSYQNCSCDKKEEHNSYKNALMNISNKYTSKRIQITKELEKIDKMEKENIELNRRKDFYSAVVKNDELNEWVNVKKTNLKVFKEEGEKESVKNQKNKLTGLETKNRFEILYENPELVEEANNFSTKFLSNSENLNIIFDWKRYKENNKRIKKEIDCETERRGYVSANRMNSIKTRNGELSIKKYNLTNLKRILIDLYLCYCHKVFPDYSYYKSVYCIRRCQSKFMMEGLKQTISLLIREREIKLAGKMPVFYKNK